MLIGLTYDLKSEYLAAGYSADETAEFDRVETIDGIEAALRELGHETSRIGHARQLVERLAAGRSWDLVFNICEGWRGPGREAQVPAILDLDGIPYPVADPLVAALCLHKELAKTIVRAAGIPTPASQLVENAADLDRVNLPFPLFAKPVAEGTGKGITAASRVMDPAGVAHVGRELLARYRQPVLFETYLPGREFTVGILGTGQKARVVGTQEILLGPRAEAHAYTYVNKDQYRELVSYGFPRADQDEEVHRAETFALAAWRALGGRDAGRIDLRSNDRDEPQFLEANPLAGLHPDDSDLPILCRHHGMTFVQLIAEILVSAMLRIEPPAS